MSDANDNDEHKMVGSLRDLPRSIEPPRDLWAGIEAKIAAERPASTGVQVPAKRGSHAHLRWIAAAAVIAALAVGMWIGRSFLPTGVPGTPMVAHTNPPVDNAAVVQAAYFVDPKFRQQHEALVQSLQAKLATLPPESRDKVVASLGAIHKSIQVLEEELGKDPTNALLQELLVNTYQDEMRVLTTVQEASDAGKGI
jgi:hypothetical protein